MFKRNYFFTILVLFVAVSDFLFAAGPPLLKDLKKGELSARINSDEKAVQTYRDGLQSVVKFCKSRADLFPAEKVKGFRPLNREAKEEIWTTWKQWLDYSMALDSIRKYHNCYFLVTNRALAEQSFGVMHAAFLAQYRCSLELISVLDNDPGFDVMLDDSVPELGLPKGGYTRFKLNFLNAARATEFAALKTAQALMPKREDISGKNMESDSAKIWEMGKKEGQIMTAENALDVIKAASSTAWLPLQTGVAIWMGDTKVWRKDNCLITQEQIKSLIPRLAPGDVLLERREWYMSNVGLPGFWPHAVIFIGTADVRQKFFDDPETREWVKSQGQSDGDFEKLLQLKYPEAYKLCIKPREENHVPRIHEAIGEGVLFTSMEHSMAADSLCALRPRLTKKERAVAIFRSFLYNGRPYDYNFDFTTDSAIVCTELVYKSFQPCQDSRGIKIALLNILGRPAIPANELIHQFDITLNTADQQFDMVFFLDGHEKDRKAIESTQEELRNSWKRPKWHVVTSE